jgi:hypothetical protein
MAGEQIPVTPALITWARERAGYSIEEAAQKFKKIAAWEASESLRHDLRSCRLPCFVQCADQNINGLGVKSFGMVPEILAQFGLPTRARSHRPGVFRSSLAAP